MKVQIIGLISLACLLACSKEPNPVQDNVDGTFTVTKESWEKVATKASSESKDVEWSVGGEVTVYSDDGYVYYAPVELPDTQDGKVFTASVTSGFVRLSKEPERNCRW